MEKATKLKPKNRSAAKFFDQAAIDYHCSLILLNAFALVIEHGLPKAKSAIEMNELVHELVFASLGAPQAPDPKHRRKLELKSKRKAGKSFALATRSSDAAKVIFSHTILDTLITTLCQVSILADPNKWFEQTKGEIDIQSLTLPRSGQAKIAWKYLDSYAKSLGQKSIKNRIKLIEQACRLRHKEFTAEVPDILEIEKLDKLRHEIIHEKWLNQNQVVGLDPIQVLRTSASYFCALVSHTYSFDGSSKQARLCIAVAKVSAEKTSIPSGGDSGGLTSGSTGAFA